jgi:cytochrome c-type biogenesis protein CcmH
MMRKLILALLVISASWFAVSVVHGQEENPEFPTDNDVNAIAKQLYCPVCPNTPLDVCGTQACKDWRNQIKDQLAAGWSEQEIIDYFVDQYGEQVLAEPERSGFTSMVWILPVIAVLLGLVILWQILRSWRNRQISRIPPPASELKVSLEILNQIEQELEDLD